MLLATTGAAVLSILHEVLDAPHGLLVMSLILAANGVIFTAIAHFWKISIHAAAYAGGVLLLAGLVGWAWLWLALLLPVIVWAGSNWSAQYPARLAAVAIVSANVLILLYLL